MWALVLSIYFSMWQYQHVVESPHYSLSSIYWFHDEFQIPYFAVVIIGYYWWAIEFIITCETRKSTFANKCGTEHAKKIRKNTFEYNE